jgi:cell division topological specificity factor
MALLDFIQRLLGLQKPSAETAKERLQLVLAHDRSDLNPELLEQMRREILEVVQKYVEIDLEEVDVSLATEDRVTALVANLPIRRARLKPLPIVHAGSPDSRTTHAEGPSEPGDPPESASSEADPTTEAEAPSEPLDPAEPATASKEKAHQDAPGEPQPT